MGVDCSCVAVLDTWYRGLACRKRALCCSGLIGSVDLIVVAE